MEVADERVEERIVELPVPHVMKEIREEIMNFPRERLSECTGSRGWMCRYRRSAFFERTREQLDEVFSWVTKEIADVVRLMPQERIQQRTADEIVVSVAHIVQVGTIIPQERLPERRVEQIGDIFVHRVGEELVEVVQTFSQERIHLCSVKQIVDFPVAHVFERMMKDIVEVARMVPSGMPSTHRGGDG